MQYLWLSAELGLCSPSKLLCPSDYYQHKFCLSLSVVGLSYLEEESARKSGLAQEYCSLSFELFYSSTCLVIAVGVFPVHVSIPRTDVMSLRVPCHNCSSGQVLL